LRNGTERPTHNEKGDRNFSAQQNRKIDWTGGGEKKRGDHFVPSEHKIAELGESTELTLTIKPLRSVKRGKKKSRAGQTGTKDGLSKRA